MKASSSSKSGLSNPFDDIELGEVTNTGGETSTQPPATVQRPPSRWSRMRKQISKKTSASGLLYAFYLANMIGATVAVISYTSVHDEGDKDDGSTMKGPTTCSYGPYRNADGTVADAAGWILLWAGFSMMLGQVIAIRQAMMRALGTNLFQVLVLVFGEVMAILTVTVAIFAALG